MDLKDPQHKAELLRRVNELCRCYGTDLASLANDGRTYKRAALLYYWLRDYRNYIRNEDTFSPQYYPAFERGHVVSLNLGFNLGAEMGGLHYGVVISSSNRRNPNLVVVPMTSVKPGRDLSQLRPTEVYLGSELYHMIQGKASALHVAALSEMKLLTKLLKDGNSNDKNADTIKARLGKLEEQIKLLGKADSKLRVLKTGSIVEINQIRTVSKMRLVDPTNEYDILYGLKVSAAYLGKIDAAICKNLTGLSK